MSLPEALRRFARLGRMLLAMALALPILASCYVPDDFLAEIRMARNGDFALVYRGKLTWAPLWNDIRDGKLTPKELEEKTAAIQRDLERDSFFTSVRSVGRGQFEVAYERIGNLQASRKVSFVRRGNAEMMSIELRSDNEVHFRTRSDPRVTPQDMADRGLTHRGRLRVVTNLPVLLHNAHEMRQGLPGYPDYVIYDWTITASTRPLPMLIGRL